MPEWIVKLFPANAFEQGIAIWLVVVGVAVLIASGGGIAAVIIKVGKFFGPRISDAFESHVKLVDTLGKCQQTQTENGSRLVAMLDESFKIQQQHTNTLEDHSERLETHGKILTELRDVVVVKGCHPHRVHKAGESGT